MGVAPIRSRHRAHLFCRCGQSAAAGRLRRPAQRYKAERSSFPPACSFLGRAVPSGKYDHVPSVASLATGNRSAEGALSQNWDAQPSTGILGSSHALALLLGFYRVHRRLRFWHAHLLKGRQSYDAAHATGNRRVVVVRCSWHLRGARGSTSEIRAAFRKEWRRRSRCCGPPGSNPPRRLGSHRGGCRINAQRPKHSEGVVGQRGSWPRMAERRLGQGRRLAQWRLAEWRLAERWLAKFLAQLVTLVAARGVPAVH